MTDQQLNPAVDASVPSALITGGSRGIGLGIAELLAARGWGLTLTARHADQLAEAAQKIATTAGWVQVVAGDIADDATISDVVDQHQRAFGSITALIMAAGVGSAGQIAGYPMSRYDKQFAVNVRAPFALLNRALPLLRRPSTAASNESSHVIAITSIDGVYPGEKLAAYGASKAALISLVHSVNAEENVHGVLATAISPAFVATELSAWATNTIPFESMISVTDVVKVVDLLLNLSPNASIPHVVINRVGAGPYRA